jgi:pyruvate carboxylase
MKMETTVSSPKAAKVKTIHLSEGAMVQQDDLVIEFD